MFDWCQWCQCQVLVYQAEEQVASAQTIATVSAWLVYVRTMWSDADPFSFCCVAL